MLVYAGCASIAFGDYAEGRPTGGGVARAQWTKSGDLHLGTWVQPPQTRPGGQHTQQTAQQRKPGVYGDGHNPPAESQGISARVEYAAPVLRLQQVEEVTERDDIESRIREWQGSGIGYDKRPRRRESAGS